MREHLLNEVSDAILELDAEGRVTWWNGGAAGALGWSADEAVGRTLARLLKPDPKAWNALRRALEKRGRWEGELSLLHRAGARLDFKARWFQQGETTWGVHTEITQRQLTESHFARLRRLEALASVATGLAHDLNNVLAPILMAVDLLGAQALDDEGRELVSLVATSARRGADLVKQVLTFARGVDGKPQPIQPGLLVNEVARMASDTFPKNVQVEVECAPGLPPVLADPTQIHQVLLNLSLNARDAMPRGGRLTLHTDQVQLDERIASQQPGARPGTYVVLRVTDTGTGMEPAVRERIFEPFFTTKPHGEGTGLGLSTALAIVKSHGGFITVTSAPNQGTTFAVHLRACPTTPPAGLEPASAPRGRGELILVVDDEDPIRYLTTQLLLAQGYRVLGAVDGAETVALYAQHRQEVDLILLDMQMPVMDGFTTISVLQRLEPAPTVVAASGFPSPEDVSRAQALGVRHFLAKPYSAEVLLGTVREALDQAPSRIPSSA